jgi:hypothetical protein
LAFPRTRTTPIASQRFVAKKTINHFCFWRICEDSLFCMLLNACRTTISDAGSTLLQLISGLRRYLLRGRHSRYRWEWLAVLMSFRASSFPLYSSFSTMSWLRRCLGRMLLYFWLPAFSSACGWPMTLHSHLRPSLLTLPFIPGICWRISRYVWLPA